MIDKADRQQIRNLLGTPQWQSAHKLAEQICDKIKSDNPVKETEWETLKMTLGNDGMVRGIQHFLQELWAHAKDV